MSAYNTMTQAAMFSSPELLKLNIHFVFVFALNAPQQSPFKKQVNTLRGANPSRMRKNLHLLEWSRETKKQLCLHFNSMLNN